MLESLFNIPKSSEHDKGTTDWRNIAKKMQSLGPGFDGPPNVAEPQQRPRSMSIWKLFFLHLLAFRKQYSFICAYLMKFLPLIL